MLAAATALLAARAAAASAAPFDEPRHGMMAGGMWRGAAGDASTAAAAAAAGAYRDWAPPPPAHAAWTSPPDEPPPLPLLERLGFGPGYAAFCASTHGPTVAWMCLERACLLCLSLATRCAQLGRFMPTAADLARPGAFAAARRAYYDHLCMPLQVWSTLAVLFLVGLPYLLAPHIPPLRRLATPGVATAVASLAWAASLVGGMVVAERSVRSDATLPHPLLLPPSSGVVLALSSAAPPVRAPAACALLLLRVLVVAASSARAPLAPQLLPWPPTARLAGVVPQWMIHAVVASVCAAHALRSERASLWAFLRAPGPPPTNAQAAAAVASELGASASALLRDTRSALSAHSASAFALLRSAATAAARAVTPPPDYAAFALAATASDRVGVARYALATLPVSAGVLLRLRSLSLGPYFACLALPLLPLAALALSPPRSKLGSFYATHARALVLAAALVRFVIVGAALCRDPGAFARLPAVARFPLLAVLDTLVCAKIPMRARPKALLLCLRAAVVAAPATWGLWPDMGGRGGKAAVAAAAAALALAAAAAERATMRGWRRDAAAATAQAAEARARKAM